MLEGQSFTMKGKKGSPEVGARLSSSLTFKRAPTLWAQDPSVHAFTFLSSSLSFASSPSGSLLYFLRSEDLEIETGRKESKGEERR